MNPEGIFGNEVFINGVRIIENYNLVKRVQFRFPKSKGKRIRKKFIKDQSNYRTKPDLNIYHIPNLRQIVCHPSVAAEIRRQVECKRR